MGNYKKLQRDMQHKVIGGVCSGLANYFGIDAALIRLLFAIAFFFFSSGFWIYVILWIVMPSGDGLQDKADYFVSPDGSAEASESSEGNPGEPNPNRGSLIAGLVLIGIGALGLLNRYVPELNWHTAWPILLIVLGLFLIIPLKTRSHEK